MFKDLYSSVKDLGDALTSDNDDFLGTMLSDETVSAGQRLQNLLEGDISLGSFDMKSVDPTAKRFQKWEGI